MNYNMNNLKNVFAFDYITHKKIQIYPKMLHLFPLSCENNCRAEIFQPGNLEHGINRSYVYI